MTRTFSTVTWGLALLVAAIVLNWTQSIPWTLTAAGAVAVIIGIVKAQIDDVGGAAAKTAADEQAKADRAAGEPF